MGLRFGQVLIKARETGLLQKLSTRTPILMFNCRKALGEAGFDPMSLVFQSKTIEWKVPSASFIFESERDAGVRNAAILAAQKPEALAAIKEHIEKSVRAYKRGDGFVISFTAHIVAARSL